MGEEVASGQGELVRDERGRFLPGTASGPGVIVDRSQAVALAQRRWELYREAAADAVQRASGGPTPFAGWGVIVERQAALAADIDKGRSSTEAARFVGSAIGVLGGPKEAETGSNVPGGVVPGAILRGLLADLRLLRDQLGEDESG